MVSMLDTAGKGCVVTFSLSLKMMRRTGLFRSVVALYRETMSSFANLSSFPVKYVSGTVHHPVKPFVGLKDSLKIEGHS